MLPDSTIGDEGLSGLLSQCTYRCVVLPDEAAWELWGAAASLNAPTGAWCSLTEEYPLYSSFDDGLNAPTGAWCSLTCLGSIWAAYEFICLNAPTGAWCSLTSQQHCRWWRRPSQCTYRCVVLPDYHLCHHHHRCCGVSQCTYRCVVLPDTSSTTLPLPVGGLNAPTGAWCSLTLSKEHPGVAGMMSQCTYRCVVLPDMTSPSGQAWSNKVSMHLQVRGAP